uniref:Uncharacterized protein MANES_10G001500 n=1 Tax=Rhizophora mucronata TaxID=61149 RepID=A0A2P2LR90_RHIMU
MGEVSRALVRREETTGGGGVGEKLVVDETGELSGFRARMVPAIIESQGLILENQVRIQAILGRN